MKRVNVHCKLSSGPAVAVGVPQGSILGPLIFLVFINDLSGLVEVIEHKIVLFANDCLLLKVKRQQMHTRFSSGASVLDDVAWAVCP